MLELTAATTANATKRTYAQHPTVRRITDDEIAVTCQTEAHAGGHVCRFERRADGALFGECVLIATGELCPAAIGKRVCYHLSAAAPLFLALEQGIGRDTELCADGTVEKAVMFDEPMPQPTRKTYQEKEAWFAQLLGYAKPAPKAWQPA
jgi:hypothetical protein